MDDDKYSSGNESDDDDEIQAIIAATIGNGVVV